jgi:hypothetical protein
MTRAVRTVVISVGMGLDWERTLFWDTGGIDLDSGHLEIIVHPDEIKD